MLPENLQWIVRQFEPEGDAWLLFDIAQDLEKNGNREGAATVYDRAFGLEPTAREIRQARQKLLDELAVFDYNLVFRYIPGGSFLMGYDQGERDEKPWHPVWLSPFWMSETPISWATYCQLMKWQPRHPEYPTTFAPQEESEQDFYLFEENKIRTHYCFPHDGEGDPTYPSGEDYLSGCTDRPMVSVSWQSAQELADQLSTPAVRFALPTEAQWEKAARGGLIAARHAWGDAQPSADNCDFNRLWSCSILPMKTFAPNHYGLYAMNGCVWEWTSDWYDRDYYRNSPEVDPHGPDKGEEKVLRGGSWADCAEVQTATFRMSSESGSWRDGKWGGHETPMFGFRLCRMSMGDAR